MTHRRNVEGLRKSAQAKSAWVLQRANEAIRLLLQQKRPVNFKTVAEAAGVSTPYLYQNQAIREGIMRLRDQIIPPAGQCAACSTAVGMSLANGEPRNSSFEM